MQLGDGSMIEYVSREAQVEAFMDALAIIDHSGGYLSFVSYRVKTGVPGEMLMQSLYIEWRDRAQATTSPEQETRFPEPPLPPDPDPTPQDLEAQLEAEAAPDTLDPGTLDEVDESSIPESVR
jgi:hypothetical protein